MPYSSRADEKAPRMKYLKAASWALRSRRAKAVRTYSASDRISTVDAIADPDQLGEIGYSILEG